MTTRRNGDTAKGRHRRGGGEPEVSLQVLVPERVKRALDLKAVESRRTRRALVLEGLKRIGIAVTDREIAGPRGIKNS